MSNFVYAQIEEFPFVRFSATKLLLRNPYQQVEFFLAAVSEKTSYLSKFDSNQMERASNLWHHDVF
jgi:hypothetical protein